MPDGVTKMLAGLMSRWMIPLVCAASSAVATCCAMIDREADRERPPADLVGERPPFEQLHRDEGPAVVLADLVDGADVRMVERRRRPRLAREPIERAARLPDHVGQELERHLPPQLGVRGAIDDAHAAAAELLDDLVVRDAFADHGMSARFTPIAGACHRQVAVPDIAVHLPLALHALPRRHVLPAVDFLARGVFDGIRADFNRGFPVRLDLLRRQRRSLDARCDDHPEEALDRLPALDRLAVGRHHRRIVGIDRPDALRFPAAIAAPNFLLAASIAALAPPACATSEGEAASPTTTATATTSAAREFMFGCSLVCG